MARMALTGCAALALCAACSKETAGDEPSVADASAPLVEAPMAAASREAASDVITDVFYSDNGVSCDIVVSVDPVNAEDAASARLSAFRLLFERKFDVCDGGVPESVNVVSVRGLDEYDQPDWSNTDEHHYFLLALGWEEFKTLCAAPSSEDCVNALLPALTKSE